MKFLYPIFLLYCICQAACIKKKVPVAIEFTPVSNDLKDKLLFKPGSYWIVSDSANASVDSIYIKSIESRTVQTATGNTIYNKEIITMNFNSNDLFADQELSSLPDQVFIVTGGKSSKEGFIAFTTESTIVYPVPGVYEQQALQNFTVGENVYPSGWAVHCTYTLSHQSGPEYFISERIVWGNKVGIVKRMTNSGSRNKYEVIRYKIVQ